MPLKISECTKQVMRIQGRTVDERSIDEEGAMDEITDIDNRRTCLMLFDIEKALDKL